MILIGEIQFLRQTKRGQHLRPFFLDDQIANRSEQIAATFQLFRMNHQTRRPSLFGRQNIFEVPLVNFNTNRP